ncbi:MAG: pseudaminic acid cytidylyltransferase [Bacteroidota bacterium]|nr:pseudaminic acid cytidylyltransferase [Bacteroidota bacterium]
MSSICIIPARGGSKRIPHKNIKLFLGKPILAYSIQVALDSQLFDEVMVSTDEEEIAGIARQYGASVPFLRSGETAGDYATLADVLEEVMTQYARLDHRFDMVCCLLSTAPLVTARRLEEAFLLVQKKQYDSVCPVVEFSYPIKRALELTSDNRLQMIWPEYMKTRSQDLSPAYHDSGSFYWVKTEALLREQTLFCRNGSAIVLPETEVQDVDTETDWALAELKYQFLHHDH